MILTGIEILKQVNQGKIGIDPFDPANATTNSYDLALGNELIKYKSKIIDPRKKPAFIKLTLPKEGLLLKQGEFLLSCTVEKIGSNHFVPLIHARSGVARLGLFVHVTADLIDIGSYGNLTLQLFATVPVKIYPGMKVAQVSFWRTKGKIKLYDGKYQNSIGPQPSKIWQSMKS